MDSWVWGQVRLRDGGVATAGDGIRTGADFTPLLRRARPQGSQASQDEIAASAYQAVILDQKYNNELVQIRVPMGKEPLHLMAIFKGQMVVYQV